MRSLSSDLSAKIRQSLQTLGNSGQPKLKIAASRAKDTITDANYWTTETIRIGDNLGDVSVAPRRLKSNGPPNGLFEIHVDSGIVSTSFRDYPDKLKQGWRPQFTLGPSNHLGSVAIAFDGYWERYRNLWRLITSEKPWIFWVDSTGILWTQHWDNVSTKTVLDTQVLRVRAIRGWKEAGNGLNDQGIVASYVKMDGTVWYRPYCIQSDYSYIWESQRQVTGFTGTAVNLNLFITNDYRLGITIETNTNDIWWLITTRSWSGMATPAEQLAATVTDVTVKLTELDKINLSLPDEHLTATLQDISVQVCPVDFDITTVPLLGKIINSHQIRLTFSHDILYAPLAVQSFTVQSKTVQSIEYGASNKEIILNIIEEMPTIGAFTVTYVSGVMAAIVTSICIPPLSNFTLTATGAPPEHKENLRANFELTVKLTEIFPTNRFTSENIKANFTDFNIVVTKLTDNPL